MVISATGWPWEYVDSLSLDRFFILARHWLRFPPAHIALARGTHADGAHLLPPTKAPLAGAPGEWLPFGEKPASLADLMDMPNIAKGKKQDPENYRFW
jgi:hypothetical protein